MYEVSDNYKTTINGYSRRFTARLKKDGEILAAEIKSYSLGKYSSTGEDFCIGCAFSSSVTISCVTDVPLKNQEIALETGLYIGSEVEYVPDGVYTITSAKKKDLVTELTGYDRMYTAGQNAFDIPFLPILLFEAAVAVAEQLGCSFDASCLDDADDLILEEMPAGTLSGMAGYLAGLIGRNAYIDRSGKLTFKGYTDSGYTFDGNRISNIDADSSARTINWLECTVEGTEEESILQSGTGSGYIRMQNPMMTQAILDNITAGIAGFSYYGAEIPFLLGDSRLDPWDIIHYQYLVASDTMLTDENGYILTDEFGNVFVDLTSNNHQISVCCHEIVWKFDGGLSMDINSCALSESEENTNFRGPMQTQIDQAKQAAAEADKKAEEVKKYAEEMNQLAANAIGYYETVETDASGSKITYMHNKPNLADSSVVYKKTIDGFFISRDGGETYVNGFDSSGNAVLNILSAIGINFDWASGGTLSLGGADNGNGELKILDASGNVILTGNKDGLKGANFSIGTDGSVSLKGDITANGKIEVSKDGVTATLNFDSGDVEILGGFSYAPGMAIGTSVSKTDCKYFKIEIAESLLLKLLAANNISSNSVVAKNIAADRIDSVRIGSSGIECDWLTVHEMVNTTTVDPTLNSDYFSDQAGSIRVFPLLGMVVWHKTFTLGSDLPANTNIQVGTIDTTYAPGQMVYLSAGIGLTPTILFIKSDGIVTVCVTAKRSAGDNLRVSGCYFYK